MSQAVWQVGTFCLVLCSFAFYGEKVRATSIVSSNFFVILRASAKDFCFLFQVDIREEIGKATASLDLQTQWRGVLDVEI